MTDQPVESIGSFRTEVVEPLTGDLLRHHLRADRLTAQDFARLWFTLPGCRFLIVFRLAAWSWRYHHRSPLDIALRLLHRRMVIRYGFEIPVSTRIGTGLELGHLGPVIVNMDAVLGCNVTLNSGVVIGRVSAGEREGSPTLGNNVLVATGVKVLGNVTIGDDVAIGANSVVIDDVVDGVTVAGLPAKVVGTNGARGRTRLVDARGRRLL